MVCQTSSRSVYTFFLTLFICLNSSSANCDDQTTLVSAPNGSTILGASATGSRVYPVPLANGQQVLASFNKNLELQGLGVTDRAEPGPGAEELLWSGTAPQSKWPLSSFGKPKLSSNVQLPGYEHGISLGPKTAYPNPNVGFVSPPPPILDPQQLPVPWDISALAEINAYPLTQEMNWKETQALFDAR